MVVVLDTILALPLKSDGSQWFALLRRRLLVDATVAELDRYRYRPMTTDMILVVLPSRISGSPSYSL